MNVFPHETASCFLSRTLRKLPLLAALLALPALAQFSVTLPQRERSVPLPETIRKNLEEYRWRFGPVRLDPLLNFNGPGYDNNVFATVEGNAVGDWTFQGSAGLNYLIPMGSKLYLTGKGTADYTWYLDLTGLRYLGGTGSGHLIGLFNRVRMDVGAELSERSDKVNQEIPVTWPLRTTQVTGVVDIDILQRLALYAGAGKVQVRYQSLDDPNFPGQFRGLDRDESGYRVGLKYAFREYFTIGPEFEFIETRYKEPPAGRDFNNTGYLVRLRYDQDRFFVELQGGLRTLERIDSLEGAQDEFMYRYFVSYFVNRNLELQALGWRRPIPSVTGASYYLETRNGGGIGVKLGSRTTLSGVAQLGSNSYPGFSDDVQDYSATLAFKVFRQTALTVGIQQTNYSSSDVARDRNIFSFRAGLKL